MKPTFVSIKYFQDVLESCSFSHGSYGVSSILEAVVNEFGVDKFELCLRFMEYIEMTNPEIILNEDLYKEEILNFKEYPLATENILLEFIYSFLSHECDKCFEKKEDDSTLSFLSTSAPVAAISEKLLKLKNDKYCDFNDIDRVLNSFKEGNEFVIEEKIKWIQKGKNKDYTYKGLWDFIEDITNRKYVKYNQPLIRKWVSNCFLKGDGSVFVDDNLEMTYKRFIKSREKDQAITE